MEQIEGGQFDEQYVLSIRVRTGRNIRGFSLPPACTRAERRDVQQIVAHALAGLQGELEGHYYYLAEMTEQEKQQLIDVSDLCIAFWVLRERTLARLTKNVMPQAVIHVFNLGQSRGTVYS